ncbi:hypothetical protein AMTRI_Chr10g227560 [Amborella trichopoda]
MLPVALIGVSSVFRERNDCFYISCSSISPLLVFLSLGFFSLFFFAADAILLGFQHYLVMLGTTVIIPTALVPQMGGGNVRRKTDPRFKRGESQNSCVSPQFKPLKPSRKEASRCCLQSIPLLCNLQETLFLSLKHAFGAVT